MSGDHGDERDSGDDRDSGDGRDSVSGGIEPLTPSDPRRIGPYPLLGRLGSGGMGRVYLARSDGGRTVAVKVVHEEHTSSGEFRARFRREIEAARRVGGHFTAPVLDADPDAARPWVATGYVPGPSLEQALLTYGPLPASSVYALADGLLRALKGIHGAGIVHRDLKPSNVLLTVTGPKVIDFGIARALQVSAESMLTSTGMVIGSPGFMAPEQILGEETGTPADVFALGCVLMYAATGQLPFGHGASNQHAVMYRIVEAAPDLTGVEDEPLRTFIARCLTKSPGERPGVDELLAGPDLPRPSGAESGAWLPPALVARLAQEAARLLDAEAPKDSKAPEIAKAAEIAETPEIAKAPEPSMAPEPDVATFGLRAAPKPEAEAQGADRRTRRNWAVAAAVIAVLASGGTVALLDGEDGAQGAPGADNSPTAPAPSGSKDSGDKGKDGKGGEDGEGGKGKGNGKDDDSSPGEDGDNSSGDAAGDDKASDDDPSSAGKDGGSDPKAPSGGGGSDSSGSGSGTGSGSGSGSDSGSGTSDNRVPQAFTGTWALTSPYVQQPQKVIIYRVAPGGYAVKLITDSGSGGHCENQARLVSVADGGKRINIGTAHVDEGRSSQIVCGDMDPSSFTLDAPSGIRHNVGPAHGDGYHYDRG
ncbi:serine/threonine protein kinase [Streptomyces sp. BA2]|uniref:serine/threonine protein kinase n=1 Tax=Streptomyces sp. BA2 TaxID=436595 RepID=UPI0013234770|nr:serine/threonine-protein kinase [Streptomyces sp. BA2]MWA15369.1 protein kinase [Streptomyces sp. BA2]